MISRILHSSYWPVFLRGDSASSKGVCRRVKFIAFLQPVTLIILAIAAIVTPLGLYEELTPSDQPVSIQFQYAPDLSPFARATTPRGGSAPLRVCYNTSIGCPGAPKDASGMSPLEQYRVWPSSIRLFTSGITSDTVSSPFDIEWRTFEASHKLQDTVDKNHTYSEGFYRQYTTFYTR